MSGFIYRDFATPKVMHHMNKVALKNLWEQLAKTYTVDGIEVMQREIYWRGRHGQYFDNYQEEDKRIRSDKTFKKFLHCIGSSHKSLASENYDKVDNAYFVLNEKKLAYTTQSASSIASKFNEYVTTTNINTTPTSSYIPYSGGKKVGSFIYQMPTVTDLAAYVFVNSGVESAISADGYYQISTSGIITLTQAGYDAGRGDVSYIDGADNNSSVSIRVKKKDLTYTTSSYTIAVYREYVDIRITVGGQYVRGLFDVLNNVDLVVNAVNLPAIRAAVESDPLLYLGNIAPVGFERQNPIEALSGHKLGDVTSAVAGIEYNEEVGHINDIFALLDDGSIYESVTPVFNEKLELVEIGDPYSQYVGMSKGSTSYYGVNSYDVSYTYTKRYKLKAMATDASVMVSKIIEASTYIEQSISSEINTLKAIFNNKATSAEDSLYNKAIFDMNAQEADINMWYNGTLRKSAFDAMSPNEFAAMFGICFEIGVTMKKGKWYNKVLAVIIVVIAVIVAVVITVLSLGTLGLVGALLVGLASGAAVLILGGMAYQKHIGDEWGMKLIGASTQVFAIATSIVAIYSGYVGLEQAIANYGATTAASATANAGTTLTAAEAAAVQSVVTSAAIDVVAASVSFGMSAYGAASQLGIGGESDSEFGQIIGIAGALYGAYNAAGSMASNISSFSDDLSNSGLLKTTFKNVTNFIKLLENGAKSYVMIDQFDTSKPQMVTEEQAVKEDGVSAVYIMQEKAYQNDALENMDNMIRRTTDPTGILLSRIL